MTPLGELGRDYHDGDVIYREGDTGSVMYVIQEGNVRISRSTERGEVSIAILGPGDVFGETAIFEEGQHSTTAAVHGGARILSVDKKKLFQGMCRDPSLAFNLLKVMSDRIRDLVSKFIRLKNSTMEIMEWGMDLEETCQVILQEARDAVEADNGSVMIADHDKQAFRIIAAFGTEAPEKTAIGLREGIAGHVLSTGSFELVKNAAGDPRFKPGGSAITSIVCIPLGTGEERFGVINMSTTSGERMFTEDDLSYLRSVSTYASVALGNAISLARLISETQDMLEKFGMRGPADH
jgi:putative methionine-R-sulfoxide reductase with GAF domain